MRGLSAGKLMAWSLGHTLGFVLALAACTTAEVVAQPRLHPEGSSMQRDLDILLASTEEGVAPIELLPADLTITLTPTPAWRELTRDSAQASAFGFYLIFEGAAAVPTPGVGYNVFWGRTEREPADVKSPGYAGTLTFYHSFQSPGRERSAKDRSIALMVTRNLRPLLEKGELARALTVTVSPAQPPEAGSRAQVRRIKLVSRRND